MKKLALFIAAAIGAIAISSCDKDDDEGRDCTLEVSSTAGAKGSVLYGVTLNSGNGHAKSVTYNGSSRNVTVNNPPLPFELTVAKSDGDQISITAIVHVDGGEIAAGYSFVTVDDETISESEACKN